MKKLDLFHDYGTIDKQIIIEYAHSLGVHFPMTYIELLSKHNGLYPVQAYVKFVNFQVLGLVPAEHFISSQRRLNTSLVGQVNWGKRS